MIESSELIPQEGDSNVGYRVFEILDEILADKESRGILARAVRNYQMYRSKIFKRESAVLPLATVNPYFTHVKRVKNQLTDNNPTFNIIPLGMTEDEKADVFDKILKTADFWWRDTEQQDIYDSSVLNGELSGSALEYMRFNPDLQDGLGDAETESVDIFNFG